MSVAVPPVVPSIGLEVHCQLKTQTKMFCGCPVTNSQSPNTAVCSICLGDPGVLPVLNDTAVRLAVRAGVALGCTVHQGSTFARKHYWYPDTPKGYQITQHERPLCSDGGLHIETMAGRKRIAIERIHLEEDAGKLIHAADHSLVDFNRCGTPLIEIVGRPDLHSADEAEAYLRMLHRVLVHAQVTDGSMEKGQFRVDANVSVSGDPVQLGPRVELKNINSFRFVRKAIDHEVERQTRIVESGGAVVQATRGWNGSGTDRLRTKDSEAEYRYCVEPDLGAIFGVDADMVEAERILEGFPLDVWLLREDANRHARLRQDHGLSASDASALLSDEVLCQLFEDAVAIGVNPSEMVKWVRGPIARWRNEYPSQRMCITPSAACSLASMVEQGTITREVGRSLVAELCGEGGDPERMVAQRSLERMDDDTALRAAVDGMLHDHPTEVQRYKQGRTRVLGFFIGLIMRQFDERMDARKVRFVVLNALEDVVSIGGSEESD